MCDLQCIWMTTTPRGYWTVRWSHGWRRGASHCVARWPRPWACGSSTQTSNKGLSAPRTPRLKNIITTLETHQICWYNLSRHTGQRAHGVLKLRQLRRWSWEHCLHRLFTFVEQSVVLHVHAVSCSPLDMPVVRSRVGRSFCFCHLSLPLQFPHVSITVFSITVFSSVLCHCSPYVPVFPGLS